MVDRNLTEKQCNTIPNSKHMHSAYSDPRYDYVTCLLAWKPSGYDGPCYDYVTCLLAWKPSGYDDRCLY